jgi:hypothetical protein
VNVRSRAVAGICVGAALLAASGCSSVSGWVKGAPGSAGVYDKVSLTYRTPSAQVNATVAAARAVEGQLVSYQQPAPAVVPNGREAILEITYPHPEGKEGYALVQVLIPRVSEEPAAPTSWEKMMGIRRDDDPVLSGKRSTYNLDIPWSELEQLMTSMREAGYFTSKKAESPTTHLTTRLDGMRVHKNWNQVPQLDALVARVYQEGAPAGAATGSSSAGGSATASDEAAAAAAVPIASEAAGEPLSSLNAYRAVVAGDNARGARPVAPREPRVTRLPTVEGGVTR